MSNVVVEILQKSFFQERMPHAVLLHSRDLQTCQEVAFTLVKIILKTESPKLHPDLHTLRPVNKMRQISVANTRSLIKNLQLSTHQGSHKVALVYEPDRMNQESANAFLKTLEEPPSDTIIFLLTTRAYDLLPTIISRCFTIALPSKNFLPDPDLWELWFQEYHKWLESLRENPAKKTASWIINIYSLVVRFDGIIDRIVNKQRENAQSSESLNEEEKVALDSGLRKGIRTRFLEEIEVETQKFAGRIFRETKKYPVKPLQNSIQALEKSNSLLLVNFQESAALEYFLLKTLRYWTYYFTKKK